MKVQLLCNVDNTEFGIGGFIKKESITSNYNYSIFIKFLWFKLGVYITYGSKLRK